jgi:ParB family chromosome partitioning protein
MRDGGRYVLVAGHYRLAAIRQAGLPTMDVMVHDGLSDRDSVRVQLPGELGA